MGAHTGCGGAAIAWPSAENSLMSRFLHFPVLLRVYLLSLVAGLPLAKAIEPTTTLPLLVQLEGQALVPFFLEQK
ncbi:MAG: hypothetical protein HON54_09980, partial [Verrucomicrobia bacterium]|nr:hypothetical protein [Verrucomicrobiota bacterium]